jgi:hypothetical protein
LGLRKEYGSLAKFYQYQVFTKGIPVDWAPEYDAEMWVSIIAGEFAEENLPEPLVKFMRLARGLPLVGIRTMLEFQSSPSNSRMGTKSRI